MKDEQTVGQHREYECGGVWGRGVGDGGSSGSCRKTGCICAELNGEGTG